MGYSPSPVTSALNGLDPRFAEEDRSSITKLWNIDPELMPGVQHGQRLHAWRQRAPAKEHRELRPDKLFRIEIDQRGCGWVGMDQIGAGR